MTRLVVQAIGLVLGVFLVGLAIQAFVVSAYSVPSASMEPLLQPGDRILVSKLHRDPIVRGDVIVFDGTGTFGPESRDFVKRVIGVAGDRVSCCDAAGRVEVNGTALDEGYVYPGDAPSELRFDVVVPPDTLWVMGDHRADSADSRAHLGDPGGGMVPVSRVIGPAVAILWPLDRAGAISASGGQ